MTSSLSENPQKVNGLAGVTFGTIVQSIVTIIGGGAVGLAYGWKLALVGIGMWMEGRTRVQLVLTESVACMPLVLVGGYTRLVRLSYFILSELIVRSVQRIVVLKDQTNKKAHEGSAQLACEAAGSIKTVASLTREANCLKEYSASLEVPLRNSNRSSVYSVALFALTQSMAFYVIALVGFCSCFLV